MDKADPTTRIWYPGTPTLFSVTDAGPTDAATGATGIAVFTSVPVADAAVAGENVELTATPIGLGRYSSRIVAPVQAGIFTQVEMPPSP
jgi:cellulase/cellobiase CelA1